MNILLWVLQTLLGLWEAVGGVYVINNYNKIADGWALKALSGSLWLAIGVLQILFAIGLVLPGTKFRKFNPVTASLLPPRSAIPVRSCALQSIHRVPRHTLGCGPRDLARVRGVHKVAKTVTVDERQR